MRGGGGCGDGDGGGNKMEKGGGGDNLEENKCGWNWGMGEVIVGADTASETVER
jgi:hypothetical protein